MKLTDEQREEIQKALEFNELWWGDVQEGEPVSQDEIDEVKDLIKHIRILLSSEQAWKEESLHLQERLKGIGVEEYLTLERKHHRQKGVIKNLEDKAEQLQDQLNQAVEVLQFYADESTYDIEHLNKHGYIIIDKDAGERAKAFLSSLSQEEEARIALRPEVQWHAEQMELTLRKNDHKGGWKDEGFRYLYSRLHEEVHEIWVEFNQPEPNWEGILRESPDASNFSMMIADLARRMISQGTEETSVKKTSRDKLREFGFEEHVLNEWSDEECDEQLEAVEMYPEG